MAHILIVDDDEIVAELATEVLLDAGYACGWVTDAEQADQLLAWRRPDLILLDQNMPGQNGSSLLRKWRSSPMFYDLPVLMFTAVSGAEDESRAYHNGAQGYLRKPVDPKFLLLKVRQTLAARSHLPRHRELGETMHLPHMERRRHERIRLSV